jgi:hypothetical protein
LGCDLFTISSLTDVAAAAEQSVKTFATVTTEYNDNKRLVTTDHDTATGAIVDVGVNFSLSTAPNKLKIKPRLRSSRFDGEQGLDTDDQYLASLYEHYTERSVFTFNIDYTRDSPLTSEFQEVEFVQVNKRRETWESNPTWSYRFSKILLGNFGLGYTDVIHQDSAQTGLIDYTYKSAFTGLSYSMSEYTQIGLTLYGSRFKAPDVKNITDDTGIQVNLGYSLLESLTLNVKYSWHKSAVEIGPDGSFFSDTRRGRLLDVEAVQKLSSGTLSASVVNEIRPASRGILEQHDRYTLKWLYHVTERTNGTIRLVNTRINDATDDPAYVKWEYRYAMCELNYQVSSGLYVSGKYQYSWKNSENAESQAESNAILLLLRYQGM